MSSRGFMAKGRMPVVAKLDLVGDFAGFGSVVIGGLDLSRYVTRFQVDAGAGRVTQVTLDLIPGTVDLEAAGFVEITVPEEAVAVA